MRDTYDDRLRVKGRGGERKRCPVQCGMCCTDGEFYTCRMLSSSGCLLEPKDRPAVCNEYLCKAAQRVLVLESVAKEVAAFDAEEEYIAGGPFAVQRVVMKAKAVMGVEGETVKHTGGCPNCGYRDPAGRQGQECPNCDFRGK